ncbi:uncharacterized protein PG986_010352 [Apiospora aurea]|uniref:Uncharacterized protein n=1 Tax=Apiospora aurea TaxID=335848 RepID=A0ABR1Q2F7_9PEZI
MEVMRPALSWQETAGYGVKCPPTWLRRPPPTEAEVQKRKLGEADAILKSWKKLRKFLANPKARDAIVKNWRNTGKPKRRQRLRRGWEDSAKAEDAEDTEDGAYSKRILERHRSDFDGILSWRPNRDYEKMPVTLDELRKPPKRTNKELRDNMNKYKVECANYNAKDFSESPGPLLELLYTRAADAPSAFFESDRRAEFLLFRSLASPLDREPDEVEEWVDLAADPRSSRPDAYGDVQKADTAEERNRCAEQGMQQLDIAEWMMRHQSRIYDFMLAMCQKVAGDNLFQETMGEGEGSGEEKPDEDEEMPDLGVREWWPQPPDDDAADDEAALNAYFEECKRLQPFTHPEDINWEFLKRLADKRCRVARSVLQGMREDPAVFKLVLQEVWDRQPVDLQSTYGIRTKMQKQGDEGEEVEVEVLDPLIHWPTKSAEFSRHEKKPAVRATTQIRDAIVTAVHQYECWSHIFRYIVDMEVRYEDYKAMSDAYGGIHPEFSLNFTTLHRLFNSLEGDLENRNQNIYYYLSALPEYQRFHRRLVQAPPLADYDEIARRRGAYPLGDRPKTREIVNMLARVNAYEGSIGNDFAGNKILTEELLQYMEEQKMPALPLLTQIKADDCIAEAYMQLEFISNPYLSRLINHIALSADGSYLRRVDELLRKCYDLKAIRYAGNAYYTTPWFQLVPSMREALRFDEYLRPEEIKTPEQRKTNIEIEKALAAFWEEFDKNIAGRDNNALPDNTKALFEDAIPLTSVAEEEEEKEKEKERQPVVPEEPAPEEPKPEEPKPEPSQPPQQPTPEPATPEPATPQPKQPPQPQPQTQPPQPLQPLDAGEPLGKKPPSANARPSRPCAEPTLKRMMQNIGYRALTKKGNGSQVTFEPMPDLVARGFTTDLIWHRPHTGTGVQRVWVWRSWVWDRTHGLITKGFTFECFENASG